MNAPLSTHPVPPYKHTPLFPLGKDATPYRKIEVPGAANGGVRVEKIMGRDVLVVEREALRALTEAAFTDINHLLRPAHLASLKKIVEDPEASANDKFVAYDFLKNANIAAGGVLPMCQDTGTAIIMGKKGRLVFTDGEDEAALAEGARDAYLKTQPALLAGRADLDVRGEEHPQQHAGAGRDLRRGRGRLQAPVHRQGRRLGQQGVPVPGDAVDPHPRPHDRVPEGEDPDARHRRVPALSPRDRHRRHLGRTDDEDRQARLDQVSRQPADARQRGRPRLPRSRDGAGGAQADAVAGRRRAVRRQVFLPRRARDPAAAPRRLAADRARRVVLGRPPGARQDHPGRRVPRRARAQPGEVSARGRRGVARRRGGADRPQPADDGDQGAAREVSDQDAALAQRPDDRGARHRARETARAAGEGAGAARLFQEPSGLLRRAGEDAGGLCVGRVRADHGGADGFVRRTTSRRRAARW